MILHMVVVCDKLDMFGYALRHPKLPASNGIVNISGLTPLTLACKLGRAEVFREMLELSAKEFWRYSNITCSAYYLNALDTLLPDGSTNWNSALFIILNGTKEEHLDMLDGGIIQRLLEEKWKTFARNQFLKRLLILVLHLILLSLAVYLRPDDPDEPLLGWRNEPTTIARYLAEIGTLLGVLSYLILQQGDEIRNQGFFTFLKQQSNSPPKMVFLISNLLILACIPCRLSEDKRTEEAILLFAVPGSWFLLMFFAGAVRLTGPFVTMIYSMITGDMLTFGIIYMIVLFGFSQSFFFLYKGFPGVGSTLYGSYVSTWMALFQITLGNYDYQELGSTAYPGVAKSVFAIFMVFVPILLLNMLIAMMGNTYAHVIEQSEKEWMKQWAKIVIALERAIPQSDAHHYLQEYSISLGGGDDPSTEQRGVMIIKSKSKTRAKQRKGALANWKRVGKVTINALKKKGMTGEEMRCLMWGRESINTPIKNRRKQKTPYAIDSHEPNLTGGFGDALTGALDVIAFTHDVDINGAVQGLNLASGKLPPSYNDALKTTNPVQFNNQMNLNINTKNANLPNGVMPLTSNDRAPIPIIVDPLKELVICSEKEEDPEKLKFLALSAANLAKEESELRRLKVDTRSPTAGNDVAAAAPDVSVNVLASVFGGAETMIKKVEGNLKKFALLDPSDTESFGEVPLLGKVSRTRRSKSASVRHSSAKSKNSDKRKLLLNSDSSTDTIDNNSTLKDDNRYLNSTGEAVLQSGFNFIDVAMGQNDLSRSVSETVNIQGVGTGAEADCGNPKSKIRKKKRAATGKTNKVAPSSQRQCKSAKDKEESDSEDLSSPDPLEPWSTKKIANMNKILAWQNDSL
ncbi:unnamed protein product [Phyllotreta striolata]|uniref:Ion transport domain-containing protein n=1 Tax=Phyllotreta striolata TaxID=444603 RepID=A0A9N9XSK8_PHYSR|nr:unnamed protein product [Phyllotreta striolata]